MSPAKRPPTLEATAPLAQGRAPRSPLAVLLRVREPESLAGKSHRLGVGKCVVGAGGDADFIITDKTVSRKHAELELVPEGVRVRDLGSRNGTFYLDQRVDAITLSPGAQVRLGRAVIALEIDEDALDDEKLEETGEYRGIVGKSSEMGRLFRLLVRLEGSLVPVVIEGESGVGKELIARAVHEGSELGAAPFVALNCGALPRDLIGSELFGHTKGAFTGATEPRKGAFESADGGTLFLDEVGELPLDMQPLLLRVLELGEVRPLGSDRPKKVKVRVVAATNRDLLAEVSAGRFRRDLYYRLAVVKLRVPPLRRRIDDVEPLARRFAREAGLGELPPHIVEQLKARSWPGNVRELRNAVHAFAVLRRLPDDVVTAEPILDIALDQHIDLSRPYADLKEELLERFMQRYLTALLVHTRGNQSQAARVSGLDRGYIGRLASKYGLGKHED